MKLDFEAQYWETYLPVRCHKPRSRETTATISVELLELTSQEAPVAIVQNGAFPRVWINAHFGDRTRIPYHFFNKELYVPCRLRSFLCLSGTQRNRWAVPTDIHWEQQGKQYTSPNEAKEELERYMSQYLMIDGKVCEKIGEPRYVIMTYGLGHNHGLGYGTSLRVNNYHNENIHRDNYYRIDQEDEANAEGIRIALDRGDTKAIPQFEKRLYDRFEIIDTSAVRCKPNTKARQESIAS